MGKAIILLLLLFLVCGLAGVAARAGGPAPSLNGTGSLTLEVPSGLQPPDYHRPLETWKVNHPAFVRAAGEQECLACHNPETFCNVCHRYAGGVPLFPAWTPTPVPPPTEVPTPGPAPEANAATSFSADVFPLLQARCAGQCHNPQAAAAMGGWDATTYDALMGTGKHAPVVQPGDPAGSLLLQKVRGTQPEGVRMPLGGAPLSEAEIRTIESWIAAGAKND
ncbi:MAG: hypothetical protein GXP41_07860 [Chloroflexi bacterium]|nr:hypothetical protein [Chloroflexota bacterium]